MDTDNKEYHITQNQIDAAIDKLISGQPGGTCIGYLDHKIQALLKLRDSGIRGPLLEQAMRQYGRLN